MVTRNKIGFAVLVGGLLAVAACDQDRPMGPVAVNPSVSQDATESLFDSRTTDLSGQNSNLMSADAPALLNVSDVIAYSVRSDLDDQLYEINLTTGVVTPIGPTGFQDVEGLSFDVTATVLYGYDDVSEQLLTCDIGTGACAVVGPSGVGVVDVGISFDDNGDLFMANDIPETLYDLDPATGGATAIGTQGQDVNGLAFRRGVLYGLGGDFTNNLVTVDRATGAATPVGPLGTVSLVDGGISFDMDGTLWGIEDRGLVFTINPSTGAATVIHNVGFGFESLAIPAPIVIFVDIDIKPGSDPNSINCNNDKGVIAVAILTTDDFDATTVDHTTVTFEGASETHVDKNSGVARRHEEDVDGDGDTDLVLHFRLGDTGLTCDSVEGTLEGETFDGQAITGTDAVRMIDQGGGQP
jgi:hypothetical protein